MYLEILNNVSIISNAILSKAGYVNPTYLLISIAQSFLESLNKK